jgi:hypothetical protein
MSDSRSLEPSSAVDQDPGGAAEIDSARIRAFLDEIERAAERLRELPLTDLTPEVP